MKNILLASLAILLMVFYSCEKDEEKDEVITPSDEISADYYFTGTINGETFSFQYMKDGFACGASEFGGNEGSNYQEAQGSRLQKVFGSSQSISFHILKRFPNNPTSEQKDEMFVLGNYPYGSDKSNNASSGLDGAMISYIDLEGTIWSSDNGTGDQTGSTFKLVEHFTNEDASYLFARNISKVKFSCKLYNDDGLSISATDCEFRGFTVLN